MYRWIRTLGFGNNYKNTQKGGFFSVEAWVESNRIQDLQFLG